MAKDESEYDADEQLHAVRHGHEHGQVTEDEIEPKAGDEYHPSYSGVNLPNEAGSVGKLSSESDQSFDE